jgi:Mitotic-spindle organizing gamma-tubulin ring associated
MQTGLSREQLRICMDLIQTGEDPKAIAVRL